ncbi:hypothetical protein B5X24_HaOG211769 [Helicoverpa armigera]|uniref:Catenin alpha n=1 Tax=Helicoverpa armigera TaxID=29058 RepID=A0A2W1B8Y2_HELAM|nr:hypothetical protein B5X24_HaOG211769 [Helicoverpa armigera]
MATMTDQYGTTGTLTLKWDPRNLEIRTMSVERTLEPLVLQVTTLVNSKDRDAKKKRPGKSKRASALVATVERATEIFIERGQTIAYENPEITQQMLTAVEEVRKAEKLLLYLPDLEWNPRPRTLEVENDLDKLKSASSQSELLESARQFGRSAAELTAQAAKRQRELKEPRMKDELAAARAVLKKHSTMLLTASKVYVRHPELAAAKANRDYVLRAVCSAVDSISAVAQGQPAPQGGNRPVEGPGELAQALDDFDERMVMEPLAYSELRTRPSLEERLEDERRERIVAECNAVRQALQDLLHEYMANTGKPEQSAGLERAIENMCRKTRDLRRQLRKAVVDHVSDRDLRRQLRKAVVDHVSDSFLETNVPLLVLMEAARNGNEKEVEEYAVVFTEHANKLVEVANLVCSMSNNEDGVKMVRHAAEHIEALCPQVKNHILEDVNKCVVALQEGDPDSLERTAGAIRGRANRVCSVVTQEMDNYEPCIYTKRVLEAVTVLRDQGI